MRTRNLFREKGFTTGIKNILILLVTVACVACSESSNLMSPAVESRTVEASGSRVTEFVALDDFSAIDFTAAGLITIRQGAEQHVKLTLDDTLWEYIHLEAENGCLRITREIPVNIPDMEPEIEVVMPELKELRTGSAGSVEGY